VVADALSRKTIHASYMMARELDLVEQFRDMQLQVTLGEDVIRCNHLTVSSDFLILIKEMQLLDPKLQRTLELLGIEKVKDFVIGSDGVLRFRGRVCIPEDLEVKGMILEEGHKSRFSMHPGMTKMYHDMKESFWWSGMKSDVARYVASCLTCQKAKAQHQRPGGMLQQLEIPEWKWDSIAMDFVTHLPRTARSHDAIWVIVDRLTKSAHFLAVNLRMSMTKLAQLYISEIVRLHGVSSSIDFDRDPRFISRFWQTL